MPIHSSAICAETAISFHSALFFFCSSVAVTIRTSHTHASINTRFHGKNYVHMRKSRTTPKLECLIYRVRMQKCVYITWIWWCTCTCSCSLCISIWSIFMKRKKNWCLFGYVVVNMLRVGDLTPNDGSSVMSLLSRVMASLAGCLADYHQNGIARVDTSLTKAIHGFHICVHHYLYHFIYIHRTAQAPQSDFALMNTVLFMNIYILLLCDNH